MVPERDVPWEAFLAAAEGHSGEYVSPWRPMSPRSSWPPPERRPRRSWSSRAHGGFQVHIASHGTLVLRAEVDGRLVGHVRHRLDRRAQLHGLCAAHCGLYDGSVYEGALDYPRPETNWQMAVEEFGVTGIFTSPTAVRALMRYGDDPLLQVDHSRLERVVCAGEVLNAPAWEWLQHDGPEESGAGDRQHVANRDGGTRVRESVRTRPLAHQARVGRDRPTRHRGGRRHIRGSDVCSPGEKGHRWCLRGRFQV